MKAHESELMLAAHALVNALDRARPVDIKNAVNECHSINDDFAEVATKRAIYNRLGYLMRQCK